MTTTRIRTVLAPFLFIGVFLLVAAACAETTPERVTDDASSDAVEVADEATDDGDADAGDASTEDEETEQNDAADDTAAEETEGDDAELDEAEGFTVGDTVRMGDLVMRLHSVRWDDGGEFMSPDEGMRWLVADIEIENESDSSTTISSLMMFDLVDEENRSRDLSFFADTEGSLGGELGAGRSMRGDLAWEVRAEQAQWELIFSPQLFGFGQAIFDISDGDF